MNTADESQSEYSNDDLLPEYSFDYSKARPNRFAAELDSGSRIVTLDPDVAKVFTTPEAVNSALRALITAMPGSNLQS
jgi:hypothetical protein